MPVATRVDAAKLERLVSDLLTAAGVPREDADIVGYVLTKTDLRGTESHGTARLSYYYLDNVRHGLINSTPAVKNIAEGPSYLVVDADNGLGHPVAYRTMERCIEKAKESGVCCATIRHSNHFGAAGIYAMLALDHDMMGLAFTNSQPLTIPTFGRQRVLGTNPIALAAPAGVELPFVLDMATSVVPIGRIEVFRRRGEPVPYGWGADAEGRPTTDPDEILEGGGLMPLGGPAESGGYKGYGLAAMVDVLCGVLSGAAILNGVLGPKLDRRGDADVGHFLMALDVSAFRPLDEFRETMDSFVTQLKESPKAVGQERIYVSGEKEFLNEQDRRAHGIPLNPVVEEDLRGMCREMGVVWPF